MICCGCSPEAPAREYELQGQILAVRPERSEVVIKHGDIKGFMPGMTMPFKVKDPAPLQGRSQAIS
jgi:Cu/Ag efflux protein CusF